MEAFFTDWVRQEESLLSVLFCAISSNDPANQSSLLSLSLAHVESYFFHKSCLADHDIIQAFYPRYLTPFESTFLWLGGFRPSLVFKFIPPPGADASMRLCHTVLAQEKEMSKQMATLQEGLAARDLLDLIRTDNHATNAHNSISMVETALHELLASANTLRLSNLRSITETLLPADATLFITKAMNFHLQLRYFGLQCDNQRN